MYKKKEIFIFINLTVIINIFTYNIKRIRHCVFKYISY